MNFSLPIGRLFGISIRVHGVFVLLLALLLAQEFVFADGIDTFLLRHLLVLFLFVVLHELGHCLAAEMHGVRVYDIVLWPLGGLARLGAIPEHPGTEFRIAIAGPAVNFFFVALLLPAHLASGGSIAPPADLADWRLLDSALFVNAMMGTFNLVPAFPLDGGRVLRALLARRLPWAEATRAAVHVGRCFAVVGAAVGLAEPSLLALTIIGVFVWIVGGNELRAQELRERLRAATAPVSAGDGGT